MPALDLDISPDRLAIAERLIIAELERRQETAALENSLIDFFRAAWPYMDPAPYSHGWHLEAIAEHLEAVSYGQIRTLVINEPPRHAKTLMTSVAWQVWTWCKRPDERFPLIGPQVKFLCMSYSDRLVLDNSTTARRLIECEWFQKRWGSRWRIARDQDAKEKFDTSAGGTRISSSFGGTVTGRGGDIRILDDPHKMDEVESETIREGVIRTYDGTLKSRFTDPKTTATVLVAQRGHEGDLSAHILDGDPEAVWLCLPAEYDPGRSYVTVLGWQDPREQVGEILWPERFGPKELAPFKINPYEWDAQWMQDPTPRGGIIFQPEWWQLYDDPSGKYPPFDLIVASLDGAFTEKEENDPSALTVWGMWQDRRMIDPTQPYATLIDAPKRVMLMDAWRKHLRMHGTRMDPTPGEYAAMTGEDELLRRTVVRSYEERCKPTWGLIEWVAHTCRRRKVDILLIEGKASGITAAQEMERLYGEEPWSVELPPVVGDKVARAMAVVSMWANGLVYAPDRERFAFSDLVIKEMGSFPKGRYDDLTDSATQAIKYLRENGLLQTPDERVADETRRAQHRPRKGALYPA